MTFSLAAARRQLFALLLTVLAAASFTMIVPACALPVSESPEAAFERYRQKINLHDFDHLADDVIAADALFVFGGERHRGIDEVRAAFNRTWATLPDEVYTMTNPEWISRDDQSTMVTFRYSYRGTIVNGAKLAGGGFGTNLFRLKGKRWWLVYEHLSPDPKLTQKSKP